MSIQSDVRQLRRSLRLAQIENESLRNQLHSVTRSKAFLTLWYISCIIRIMLLSVKKVVELILRILVGMWFVLIVAAFYFLSRVLDVLLLPIPWVRKSNINTTVNGVSIIIPTWNKKDLIISCLSHLNKILLAHKRTQVEIIVVDNGSDDGTFDAVKRFSSIVPLRCVPLGKNYGFAHAINEGVKVSKYNYVYLLNNDVFPHQGFLVHLLLKAESLVSRNKPFFSLSSQIFFSDKKKRREESGKTYMVPYVGYLQLAHCVSPYLLRAFSPTLYSGGGSSLFNKSIFMSLGGFDSRLFKPMYVEDLDLGVSAWKSGYPSYFVPDSKVDHDHRSSTTGTAVNPDNYIQRNILLFVIKHSDTVFEMLRSVFGYMIHILIGDTRFVVSAVQLPKYLPFLLRSRLRLQGMSRVYSFSELRDFPKLSYRNLLREPWIRKGK